MRIFLPSARAFCADEALDRLARHSATPMTTIFHDFISMMILSPLGENNLRIPDAVYYWQRLAPVWRMDRA